MNVADFKSRVAGFMSRNTADFVQGSVDQLLCAINDARRMAQQRYTFKRLSRDGFIRTSILGSDIALNGRVTPEDAGTLMVMKSIHGVYTFQSRSIPAGTFYERTSELDYRKERELYADLPLGVPYASSQNNHLTQTNTGRGIAWMSGQSLYTNSDTANYYSVKCTELLPDLAGSESSDFFITNAEHWLVFAAAQILNGFIKEDQRVVISNAAMQTAWENFTQFDADVASSDDGLDLD